MKISSWIKRLKKDLAKETSKGYSKSKKNRIHIERSLLSRLRILGFILLGFSALFLFYALNYSPTETILIAADQPGEEFCREFLVHETLNFFIISAIFCAIGLACVFIPWKQKN